LWVWVWVCVGVGVWTLSHIKFIYTYTHAYMDGCIHTYIHIRIDVSGGVAWLGTSVAVSERNGQ
jgi:hypothetical protein